MSQPPQSPLCTHMPMSSCTSCGSLARRRCISRRVSSRRPGGTLARIQRSSICFHWHLECVDVKRKWLHFATNQGQTDRAAFGLLICDLTLIQLMWSENCVDVLRATGSRLYRKCHPSPTSIILADVKGRPVMDITKAVASCTASPASSGPNGNDKGKRTSTDPAAGGAAGGVVWLAGVWRQDGCMWPAQRDMGACVKGLGASPGNCADARQQCFNYEEWRAV